MFSNQAIAVLVAIFLLTGATQCSTQSVPPIAGKIALSEAWKPVVYLVQPWSFSEIASSFSGVVLDSARISSDGSFAFSKIPVSAGKAFFQLCVQQKGNRFANQLLDDNPLVSNYMPIVLGPGESLKIQADAARFQASFSVSNPDAAQLALLHLRDIRHQTFQKEQSWLNPEVHADENTLLDHEAALLRFQNALIQFADSSSQYWAAMLATRWVSPASDYERVPEFMFRQCEKWRVQTPDQPWVGQLCSSASREKLPVLLGDKIPDFPLPMLAGDTLQLYKLLGKKLTVVDIWASWCAPCRRENRDVLQPIWKEYEAKGLQILGYSIDSSPAAWKAAIAKDGANWPHASHLSGDETPFLQALRITTIPANFILDEQGKVLGKNLHGEALRVFLRDYFK